MFDASGLAGTPNDSSFPARIRRGHVDLFLISFVGLFHELACIRWFGSTVIFLTFFTNLVLMACFLGLSVGCLAARSRRHYIEAVLPLTLVTMVLAFGLLWGYAQFGELMVDVGGQASPQQVYFGTEARTRDLSTFVIPLEVIAGVFFTLISLSFIGIGQTMGRAFNAMANPIQAYTVNLLGSLAGIAGFAVLSYLGTAPPVWFAVSSGLILYFNRGPAMLKRPARRLISVGALAMIVVGLIVTADLPDVGKGTYALTFWSPYYKIRFEPGTQQLYVNNIQHQEMHDLTKGGAFYQVPYLMNRYAGGRPFEEVLIIGAGSGNDVATALAQRAKHVDAVEIDPELYEIGRKYHPNRHGADPRVTPHIDDGRSFVRSTGKKYDLIVYALVDSLVLHSGYSSIRLESFLFTEQAFRDLKDRLQPDGVFVIYNYYRQGWVVARLAKLAERVFGTAPIVLSLPYQATISAQDHQGNKLSYFIVGTEQSAALSAIRARLRQSRYFWVHPGAASNGQRDAYGATPPSVGGTQPGDWYQLGPAEVRTEGIGPLPTDDFPFLYLREPIIPALNLRGMLIVAMLSLAVLFAFAPVRTARPNGQMFFLGAGFMLLETKGVVHLALLFGSTWMVNSIVFAAILAMALSSNLYVLAFKPRRLWPYYVGLIASLLLNLAVPMTSFLSLPGALKVIASCLVVFVPVFFAGVVFAATFRASQRPDLDFGSNIGGVILGGLSENLSLMVGFTNLLLIAIGYYVLSAILAPRGQA
jgi:SAM-dependent methyltransferase